jgi:general secretion pathway protein H
MPTSTPGMRNRAGFTLIELSVVLFLLGLFLWLVAPRLSTLGSPSREAVFRDIAAGSEEAFDTSLFEKKEVRLRIDPAGGTYRFRIEGESSDTAPGKSFGDHLAVTGIRVGGEDRPPDIVTEIRYLPGGKVSDARIFLRDSGAAGEPTAWTLHLQPVDGTVDVLEGSIAGDG